MISAYEAKCLSMPDHSEVSEAADLIDTIIREVCVTGETCFYLAHGFPPLDCLLQFKEATDQLITKPEVVRPIARLLRNKGFEVNYIDRDHYFLSIHWGLH